MLIKQEEVSKIHTRYTINYWLINDTPLSQNANSINLILMKEIPSQKLIIDNAWYRKFK